jgi:glycosyltransferase involved in cell wall biosynthesis
VPEHVLLVLGPSAGGIRRHVAVLRDGLRGLGWTVTTAGPAGVLDGLDGVDVAVPISLSPFDLVRAARALHAAGRGASVVHAHGLKAGAAVVAAGLAPRVLTVHNVVLDDAAGVAAPVLRAVERRLPGRMDHTISVSSEIAGRLGVLGDPRASVVVPAGTPPTVRAGRAAVRSALAVSDAPLVVTAARMHPQKDLGTFLAAMHHARTRVPELRVAIAGDGPEAAAVRSERTRLGLEDTVQLLGQRDDVPDLLAAADVVALSSIWEGSPLVVAEAMLLGRSVVATAVGAVPEAVVDGVTGRLVPPRDAVALGDAVADLLLDPGAAQAMAIAGKELADERFATDVLVAQVADVYADVMGATP